MKQLVITALSLFLLFSFTHAETIYVMGSHSGASDARTHLAASGHTVTNGGTSTLNDYSAFDQVWDLRHNVNLNSADFTAMGNYIANGGRMYLTGENSNFDGTRNGTLLNFLSTLGAGTVTLRTPAGSTTTGHNRHLENMSSQGQALLNNPNTFSQIDYNFSRAVNTTQGFLVTEHNSGGGSIVAWDFGDITGKPSTRMIVGFDINMFQVNPQTWTENLATFLAAEAPPTVPEPASYLLLAMAGLGLLWQRQR